MRSLHLVTALVALGSSSLLVGCPHFVGNVCEEVITCTFEDGGDEGGRPPTDGAVRPDGGLEGGPDVPTCDSTQSPKDAPCVVDDAYGVFANAATGVDTNAGTRAAPKKTIGAALVAAKAAGKRVFVCEGTYAENVVIDSSKDGARVYGGLACATWTYDATKRPLVKPAAGFALKLAQVTDVRIEDVAFTAPDGASAGQSSVAAFATSAGAGVVLRRVALTAGKGFNGAPGTPGVAGTSTPADQTGNAGTALAGGEAKSCACSTGGTTVGGKGGFNSSAGSAGMPTLPENPTGQTPPQDGAGGAANQSCVGAGSVHNGADAPVAGDGPGASALGALDANGWTPAAGTRGVNGGPGQGGGGGGSRGPAGGGGSGGCGACGGGGGGNGGGGGASIALLAFESPLGLEQCELATAKAGDGGGGATGADGQQVPGVGGISTTLACAGGDGGKGGKGGAGGGGAGGVSVGVLHKGASSPKLDTSTVTVSATGFGAAGSGGKATNPGLVGVAQADLALP